MFNLGVFCGSHNGDGYFSSEAVRLGKAIAVRKIRLVYGGASIGTMGVLADSVLDHGGEVYGVIPRCLVEREVAHSRLTRIYRVESMHERKQLMFQLADAFLTLPGGFGTLDETFEVLTWKQIGIHQKRIVLANLSGYFNQLVGFLDHAVAEGFTPSQHRAGLMVADSIESALDLATSGRIESNSK